MKTLQTAYEKEDSARDKVITISRDIIKQSKKIISAVHKEEIDAAQKLLPAIEESLKEIKKNYDISRTGSFDVAVQEYVEAILYLEYVATGKILPLSKFESSASNYIMGLCDFVGELQRRSVMQIAKGNNKEISKIYKDVEKIYTKLLNISMRGEMRKKFDSLKYIMIRMEEMQMQLKLKE